LRIGGLGKGENRRGGDEEMGESFDFGFGIGDCGIYRLRILDFSPPWPPLSPSWRLYEPEAGL